MKQIASKIEDLQNYVRFKLFIVQARYQDQKTATDRPHDVLLLASASGWTLRTSIRTALKKKFDWKNLEPNRVSIVASPYAYQLHLPESRRIDPFRYNDSLRPADIKPLLGLRLALLPDIAVDGEKELEVEDILDSRLEKWYQGTPCQKYLVRSTGYADLTWKPAGYWKNVRQVTVNFHWPRPHQSGLRPRWSSNLGKEKHCHRSTLLSCAAHELTRCMVCD